MSHHKSHRARGAFIAAAALTTFALASCSSDKTEPEPAAGTGGVGGAGAQAGVGGGAGSSAGTSTAGSAGRSAGGAGGSSGSASTTGGAGTGTGGTAAGTGGQAGSATAGAGGTSGGIGFGGEAGGGDDGGTSGLGGRGGASSGGSGGAAAGAGGSGGAGGGGTLTITSPDHAEGVKFADKYTCTLAGFNGSLMPELVWSGAPAGTNSFAITFIDTTIAAKTPPNDMNGYHWAIYNIPKETMGLPEEFKTPTGTMKQTGTFLGPCPNVGGGSVTDQYEFTIYALAEASITVAGSGTTAVKNAKTMLEATHLAKATLTGSSDASPP